MNTESQHGPRATAVVIGRAGSKGLPGKNECILAGRPMVEHTLAHLVEAQTIGRVIVSTDSTIMAESARVSAGRLNLAVEVIDRPVELASDTATVDAAVRHAVSSDDANVVVILYANVPVRPAGLVDQAVNMLLSSGADSVQSYAEVEKYHAYWQVRIDDDSQVSQYITNRVYRRQDLPPLYVPDGGVIAVTRSSLFSTAKDEPHAFLGSDRRAIINPPGSVIDIDSAADLARARSIMTECEESNLRLPDQRADHMGVYNIGA